MASGKTPMTDTMNALRTKHGLHCATNPAGLTRPQEGDSVEDRAAYMQATRAYRREAKPESRKIFLNMLQQTDAQKRVPLSPAERRKYHAKLRAKQLAAAQERRAST